MINWTTVTEHDGFLARVYDGHELAHGDTVWIEPANFEADWIKLADIERGEWAEVDEDGDATQDEVVVRIWGTNNPITIPRDVIKHEKLHSCECGAVGPDSWRICHPEA